MARQLHADISADFRNRKHKRQWITSLETHVPTAVWTKPIAEVTSADLLDFLRPLYQTVPETARRVRQRLADTFGEAILMKLCQNNPADDVKRALQRGSKRTAAHFRSLPYPQVPAFIETLRNSATVGMAVRLAVEFTILTAARSGETRGARWHEIEGHEWVISGRRMKGGQDHRVHLSKRALEILEQARPLSGGDPEDWIFPAPRNSDKALSDMTLTMALRRIGYGEKTVVHGFRSSFSTWARAQTQFTGNVIEAALAHKEQDRVAAAYNRATFQKQRAALLDQWATFCTTPQAKPTASVIPMRRKR